MALESILRGAVVHRYRSGLKNAAEGKSGRFWRGPLRGELVRLQEERDQARMETRQEREIAEGLRIDLARASLQLESLPTLQAELSSERAARIAAEKQAAVLEERMQWAPPPSRG